MTRNLFALAAALLVLALIGVEPIVYLLILVAGAAPSLVGFWRSTPRRRLAQRARQVAERTRTSRVSARGRKLNGSAC